MGSFLGDFGSAGVPVGGLFLLAGQERSEVLLVQDTLVGATSGLSGLFHLGDFRSLLSDLTGLGEGAVLLSH